MKRSDDHAETICQVERRTEQPKRLSSASLVWPEDDEDVAQEQAFGNHKPHIDRVADSGSTKTSEPLDIKSGATTSRFLLQTGHPHRATSSLKKDSPPSGLRPAVAASQVELATSSAGKSADPTDTSTPGTSETRVLASLSKSTAVGGAVSLATALAPATPSSLPSAGPPRAISDESTSSVLEARDLHFDARLKTTRRSVECAVELLPATDDDESDCTYHSGDECGKLHSRHTARGS